VDFLLAVIKERAASDKPQAASREQITAAIAQAEEDMLHNGIVAVGDICNTAHTIPQKKEGRLFYHNFIEAIGFADEGADKRFAASLEVFNEFAEAYNLPVEANSIAPHAPYSVGSRLFGLIANFPGNHVLTIHNQEDGMENEFYHDGKGDLTRLYKALGIDTSFFRGTGKRSLESFLPHFYRNQNLILVHNVATGEEDLRFALDWQKKDGANLFFCLCPNANMYISGQLPDLELLIKNDCRIVVGTDSLASNHQLSVLEELKTLQSRFPALSATTLLRWATYNGAQALQLDSVLGEFSPGRQPGVLLIEDLKNGRFGAGSAVKRLL
jgi:cytosine/adenosine deaminase-related metal-dependent hydrolase